MRLLEIKVFNDDLPISQIVDFIRNYNLTETMDGNFINNATKSSTLNAVKKVFALSKLDNAQLKKRDIDNILNVSLEDYFNTLN